MKLFLKNLFFLVLLVIPLLYVVNYITDKGMSKSGMEKFAEWNDIYASRINANVLIMGSSKAKMIISPKILDSTLHVNSYNLGMDGWQFNMQYARFRIYLQHNKKPAYIIQAIDFPFFEDRADLFEYDQFIPYLTDSIIRNTTSQYTGRFTFPELYFPFFKYNHHLTLIQEGIKNYFKKDSASPIPTKGYQPWELTWDSSFNNFKRSNPDGIKVAIQKKMVDEFTEYLQYCKDNNIQVIFEMSPVYCEVFPMEKNLNDVQQIFNQLASKYNIPILDYSRDTLSLHKKYFFNSQHLNKTGAEIYSHTLANGLKDIIRTK